VTDVLVAAGGAAWEAEALHEIEGSAELRLVRRCVDVADLLAAGQTGVAPLALVAVGLPGLDADVVHTLGACGVRVVAVEADQKRCVALGITASVARGSLASAAVGEPPSVRVPDAPQGRLVTVWGTGGAPGRSSVSLSLAAAWSAAGRDTVLVDADTDGGSIGQMLAVLDDVSGIMAAARAANNGQAQQVGEHLLTIEPRLRLLTGLPRGDMWPHVRLGALEQLLRELRNTAEVVVVDVAAGLDSADTSSRRQVTRHLVEQADEVLVLGRADPVGLARLVRALHELEEHVPGIVPRVVVTMVRPSIGWGAHDIETTVMRLSGVAPTALVPFDQSTLDHALVAGRLPRDVARQSPFAAAVQGLAEELLPTPVGARVGRRARARSGGTFLTR